MTLTATIANTNINIYEGSWKVSNKIDQQGSCNLTVIDTTGTANFFKYQPVSIVDNVLGTVFTGIVDKAKATKLYPQPHRMWAISCIDQSNLANRRTSKKQYNNQFAGTIFADQVQRYLAPEGVTGPFALDWDELLTDWQAGTLSNTTASTNASDGNAGDGDLELAPAGSDVTKSEATTANFSVGTLTNCTAANNSLSPTTQAAMKLTGSMEQVNAGNAQVALKVWSGSMTIGTSDTLHYEIWVDGTSTDIAGGIDFVCSDGTVLSNTNSPDQLGYPAGGTNLLAGIEDNRWYSRTLSLASVLNGKTIASVNIVLFGTKPGVHTIYVKNLYLGSQSGSPFFATNATTFQANPPQVVQNTGWQNVSISVVQAADPNNASRVSTSTSINAVKLLKNSFIHWRETVPGATFVNLSISYDGGQSYLACTNDAPLPGMPPGSNLTGLSIQLLEQFGTTDSDPTLIPVLNSVSVTLQSATNTTKSDVISSYVTGGSWAVGGTPTNLANTTGNILALNGILRNWDDANSSGISLYGNGSPASFFFFGNYILTCAATNETRAWCDFAGQWSDFTWEFDVFVDTSGPKYGCVYRTTNWLNTDSTWAYAVELTDTTVELRKGTNGGGGPSSSVSGLITLTTSISLHNWVRLKIVAVGSSHKVYVNDVLCINSTDSTYLAAGYVGFRNRNTTAGQINALFDNFGIVPALSGAWVSNNIVLTGAGSYGNSVITWKDASTVPSQSTILVEASINGGSTWQTCTNGQAIPNFTAGQSLSGVNLLLRVTLTTNSATNLPGIQQLTVRVLGAFSASGTRISPALSLAKVLPRAGTALVNWNANQPLNTIVTVDTSIDNQATWQNVAASGNSISGINLQPAPYVDGFDAIGTIYVPRGFFGGGTMILPQTSIGNYIQTALSGSGTPANWAWDTTNSRLIGTQSSGFRGVLEYAGMTFVDGYAEGIFDRSDTGGLVIRMTGPNNAYYLVIRDASANSGTQNTATLNKIVAGTITQLAQASIAFTRGTYHDFRLDAQGSALTVLMDGTQIISATDSSLSSAGMAGVLCATSTSGIVELYNLRIQPYGDDVHAKMVYTRVTLTSTDPTVSPQMLDMQCFVSSPALQAGILMPATNYVDTFVSNNIADLTTQSNYWSNIDYNKNALFQARTATPAPWPIASVNQSVTIGGQNIGDVLVDSLSLEPSGDLYRNRQTIKGAIDTGTFNEIKAGDGTSQSWSVAYPLTVAPTILLNGQKQTVAVKDSGVTAQFYYQVGSNSIDQDSSGTTLQKDVDELSITYTGSFEVDVTIDNTGVNNPSALPYPTVALTGTFTQAQLAALDSSSGIVESVFDATGQNMTKAAAITYATQLLQRYGNPYARTLTFKTLRSGLQPGQQLTAFVPEQNCVDVAFLVVQVDMTITTLASGVQQFFYTIIAMEGANLGNWVRLFAAGLKK